MVKLEYVWLDGYKPEPNLRSKVKIVEGSTLGESIESFPMWNFDGSSTQQAEGHSSDCILKPVRAYYGQIFDTIYVFCEVMNSDGTPHVTNRRSMVEDQDDLWFGFEQEYFIREEINGGILEMIHF